MSDWISEEAGSRLHFTDNLQWYTPQDWKGDGRWQTPQGILVKHWLISRGKRALDSAEVARLYEATCEMSPLKITQAPLPLAQDDFHLWMIRGRGQKQNARHQVEPVVWHACLVEPLHPVRVSGYTCFTAFGPPGSEAGCEQTLLQLTRTVERSKNGALPPRIKARVPINP